MAYRETPRMKARKEATRQRILDTTHALVAENGFRLTSVAGIADRAGVAIGSVYRHFESKSDLFAEVFRSATELEVRKVAEALATDAPPDRALVDSLRVFAGRATRGPTMAWALIAEPVDRLVDEERLRYRQAYAELFQRNLERGMEQGCYRDGQDPHLNSAAIVGAIAEALVGPLSPAAGGSDDDSAQQVIENIVRFCMQAVRNLE